MSRIAQDRLQAAVAALAGHGTLKDRIACAWSAHLDKLDPLLLPEAVRAQFVLLGALLHSARALPGDTVVRASARKLGPAEAMQVAGFMVQALACAAEQCGRDERLAAEQADEAARAPPLRLAGAG